MLDVIISQDEQTAELQCGGYLADTLYAEDAQSGCIGCEFHQHHRCRLLPDDSDEMTDFELTKATAANKCEAQDRTDNRNIIWKRKTND